MLAVLVAAADGAADSTAVHDGPIKYSTDLKVQTAGETPTTKLTNSYLLWVDGDKLFIDFVLETADAEYDTTVATNRLRAHVCGPWSGTDIDTLCIRAMVNGEGSNNVTR